MLRILLTHYSFAEYELFKTDFHKISSELTVSHIECEDQLLNLLNYFIPDILFMNFSVEDKASIRCLQQLRSGHRFNSLPVVIYSQDPDWRYVKEYYFSNSNHHLAKPYSFENLCNILEQTFKIDFSDKQLPFKKALVTDYAPE